MLTAQYIIEIQPGKVTGEKCFTIVLLFSSFVHKLNLKVIPKSDARGLSAQLHNHLAVWNNFTTKRIRLWKEWPDLLDCTAAWQL